MKGLRPREREMRCGSCDQHNRDGARFCDACASRLKPVGRSAPPSTAGDCVSCGKPIDLGVYFNMCPHCGFNYRIEITPVTPGRANIGGNVAGLYAISAVVPAAGFVVGAILAGDESTQSRKAAGGCVALAALNIVITPLLILRLFGLA